MPLNNTMIEKVDYMGKLLLLFFSINLIHFSKLRSLFSKELTVI